MKDAYWAKDLYSSLRSVFYDVDEGIDNSVAVPVAKVVAVGPVRGGDNGSAYPGLAWNQFGFPIICQGYDEQVIFAFQTINEAKMARRSLLLMIENFYDREDK
jgi:hypothetical protein